MTDKEKAELFDELVKRAYCNSPSYGYHTGGWVVHVSPKGDYMRDCPRDFIKALKELIKEDPIGG